MPGWPLHVIQMVMVLLVVLGPVPLALSITRRESAGHGALEHWLATCVMAVGFQVATGLGLGMIGLFDLGPLLAVELVLLFAGGFALRRTGMPRLLPATPLDPVESGALTVLLIAAGLGFADLVVHPTRNFDSLAYHLPVMARWVSSSSLEVFTQLGQVALYPSHFEVLSAMMQLPARQDVLIAAPNLLAWGQLGLAILLLGRALGANRSAGIVAASLVLLTPSVLSRLDAIQPDILLAATFLTALGFALRARKRPERLDLLVILLSIGLIAGLKLSGPVFVLMLLPVVLLGATRSWRPSRAMLEGFVPSGAWRMLGVWAAFAVGLALFWYLRNWVTIGNPFGDLEIHLFGATLFDGSITRADLSRGALSNVFRWSSGEDWAVLGGVLREWLGAGAVLLFVAASWSARARSLARATVAVVLLFCLILYWRTPYSADNGTHGWQVTPWIEVGLRYGFPVLALLGSLAAAGMSTNRWWPRAGLAVLVVTAVMTVLEHLVPHVGVLIAVVVLAWAFSVLAMRRGADRRLSGALAILVLCTLTVGLGLAREYREVRRGLLFGKVLDVMEAELTDDDVIMVVHSQKLHVAAGLDWKRRVELAELPAAGRENAWASGLRSSGVTALLVGHKKPAPDVAADVRRVQAFIRESGQFEMVVDYESLSKDLALFRVLGQSSR
jgi:hypothetical protein